jgi:2-iminobutanoate/2-iminopropanoate deaminase
MKRGIILFVTAFALGTVIVGVWPVFAQQTPKKIDVAALPFSPARQAGPTLYVSGQIPVKADGTTVTGDIAAETRQTMDNIGAILKDHGRTFADVVNVTVYLSDMKHYPAMNAAYREYFPEGKFPARACVGGLQLAFGADLEISAIAYKDR